MSLPSNPKDMAKSVIFTKWPTDTGNGWLTKGTKISEMQSSMINLNQISLSVKTLERPQTNQMANL